MVAMVIVGLRLCWKTLVSRTMPKGLSVSGDVRGWRSLWNNLNGVVFGSMMDHVWDWGLNHVWSYDFVHDRTYDGKAFRTLNILDEYTRECLAIRVERKLNSQNVIDELTDLFIIRGFLEYIRSDNGLEFVAKSVRDWISAVGAKTAYIEPGSPWENRICESFNAQNLETNSSMERYSIHLRKRRFS